MEELQRAQISTALARAEAFVGANGFTTNLTTYADIRELGNGSGDYGVHLYALDAHGYEVTVRVTISTSGYVSEPQGFDGSDSWAMA